MLNEEEREMAAQAWDHGREVVRKFERSYPGPDYDGAFAERLCGSVPRYDGSRSSPWEWARRQATGACLDARRRHGWIRGPRDGEGRRAPERTFGLASPGDWDRLAGRAAVGAERDPAAGLMVGELLGALPDFLRRVVVGSVVEGYTLRELGAELGVSEVRACQWRKEAFAQLRERWGDRKSA